MADETYRGLGIVLDPAQPHLGGNIDRGDPYTFCPATWNYVLQRAVARSHQGAGAHAG
jgi:hypothetical protein